MTDPWSMTVEPPTAPDVDPTLPSRDPFTGTDPGPGSAGGDHLPPDAVGAVATINEAQVRRVLVALGDGLSEWIGHPDVEDHWRFTEEELAGLVPALTSIASRTPRLAQAIEHSDMALVAWYLSAYGMRNVRTGLAARRADAALYDLAGDVPDGPPAPRFPDAGHDFGREAAPDRPGPVDLGAQPGPHVAPAATGPAGFTPAPPG